MNSRWLLESKSKQPFRFVAYKQFIWFAFIGIGKKNRRVITSCVTRMNRVKFPEEGGERTNIKTEENIWLL